jgi:hypothetical protein
MKPKRGVALLLLAVVSAGVVAQATTLVQMDLDQLTAAASVVARVRCVADESRWEGGEIYTFTTFEVIEALKGIPPQQITVRLIGGRVGSLISKVEGVPRFQPGEETFLFLEPKLTGDWGVSGWVQGTFRIRRDPRTQQETVSQDTSGVSVFDPQTRQFRAGGVRNLSVEQFKQRVAAAIEQQRGVGQP